MALFKTQDYGPLFTDLAERERRDDYRRDSFIRERMEANFELARTAPSPEVWLAGSILHTLYSSGKGVNIAPDFMPTWIGNVVGAKIERTILDDDSAWTAAVALVHRDAAARVLLPAGFDVETRTAARRVFETEDKRRQDGRARERAEEDRKNAEAEKLKALDAPILAIIEEARADIAGLRRTYRDHNSDPGTRLAAHTMLGMRQKEISGLWSQLRVPIEMSSDDLEPHWRPDPTATF